MTYISMQAEAQENLPEAGVRSALKLHEIIEYENTPSQQNKTKMESFPNKQVGDGPSYQTQDLFIRHYSKTENII